MNLPLTVSVYKAETVLRKVFFWRGMACSVIPLYHHAAVWFTKPYLHRDYPVMGEQNFKDWRIDPR